MSSAELYTVMVAQDGRARGTRGGNFARILPEQLGEAEVVTIVEDVIVNMNDVFPCKRWARLSAQ